MAVVSEDPEAGGSHKPDEPHHLPCAHPPARTPRQGVRQLQEGQPLSLKDALGPALGSDDLGQNVLVPPVVGLLPEDTPGVVVVQ
jgi:hypothetical protein